MVRRWLLNYMDRYMQQTGAIVESAEFITPHSATLRVSDHLSQSGEGLTCPTCSREIVVYERES